MRGVKKEEVFLKKIENYEAGDKAYQNTSTYMHASLKCLSTCTPYDDGISAEAFTRLATMLVYYDEICYIVGSAYGDQLKDIHMRVRVRLITTQGEVNESKGLQVKKRKHD